PASVATLAARSRSAAEPVTTTSWPWAASPRATAANLPGGHRLLPYAAPGWTIAAPGEGRAAGPPRRAAHRTSGPAGTTVPPRAPAGAGPGRSDGPPPGRRRRSGGAGGWRAAPARCPGARRAGRRPRPGPAPGAG